MYRQHKTINMKLKNLIGRGERHSPLSQYQASLDVRFGQSRQKLSSGDNFGRLILAAFLVWPLSRTLPRPLPCLNCPICARNIDMRMKYTIDDFIQDPQPLTPALSEWRPNFAPLHTHWLFFMRCYHIITYRRLTEEIERIVFKSQHGG